MLGTSAAEAPLSLCWACRHVLHDGLLWGISTSLVSHDTISCLHNHQGMLAGGKANQGTVRSYMLTYAGRLRESSLLLYLLLD
jgi:hypothetical protein